MRRLLLLVTLFVLGLAPAAQAKSIKIYVLRGEALTSVKRNVATGAEPAIRALLAGPTAAERKKGYGTAIPSGVTFTKVVTDDDEETATVTLSNTFAVADVSYLARVAQLVYTVTAATGVDAVEVRGRKFTRADFAPPEEYVAPKPPTKKPLAPADPTQVQTKLSQLGYLPEDAITGKWDYRSAQAVLAFQSWEGLERDGIAGEMTVERMNTASRPLANDRTGTERKVEIHKTKSVVLLIEAGRVVRAIHTSTGVGNNEVSLGTPAGTYKITRKVEQAWSVPFKTWLPLAAYWGTGLALYGATDVPAGPASYGGARLPIPEAQVVYDFVSVGTPVRVL